MHFGYFTVDLFDCPPFKMFSNGDDPRALDILESKRFEPHSMALWCRFARQATSIIDIGAHTGVYALAAASLRKDIVIHAFEPNPLTAARLIVNRGCNAFHNVQPYMHALGKSEHITEISWNPRKLGWLSSGSTVSGAEKMRMSAPVQVRPLDAIDIHYGALPLVKIDVEGQEVFAFKGMSKCLAARPIIILESFKQNKCDEIAAMLPGYFCFRVIEDGGLEPLETLRAADRGSKDYNQLLLPRFNLL